MKLCHCWSLLCREMFLLFDLVFLSSFYEFRLHVFVVGSDDQFYLTMLMCSFLVMYHVM